MKRVDLLVFLALNGAAVFVALRAALAAGADARASRLILCVLSGYLVVIHSVVLDAGLLGWLTVAGVATFMAVAVTGALWLAPRRREGAEVAGETPRVTRLALFAPLLAIVAGIAWTWPHLFGPTRLWIWDDYTYHMVYPALWLRQHAIGAVAPGQAFTMQAWYPLSASVVATWLMLPFRGARAESLAWVSLTAPLYFAIVAAAAAELLGRVRCHPWAWAVPVLLFATSRRTAVMASTFSDADLAYPAALIGAFAFAIPRDADESWATVLADAAYTALLTGFAVGVKVTAAPYAALVLLLTALRATSLPTRWRAGATVALAFGVSWLATGGYWYVRNLVHTGNPLYPAAFLGLGGATFPRTTLREYAQHYGLTRAVRDALAVYMNWPWFHAALAAAGLAGLAGWLLARRSAVTRSQAYFAGGTLGMGALMLVLLPATPFSAGNAMTFASGFVHWDSMRYAALLLFLGWLALGFLVDAATPECHREAQRHGARWGGAATAGVAVVLAGIVVSMHGAKSAATAAAFYREPLFGAAVAVLDRHPPGTRVAIFGDQWVYPAFGARDHLVPVRLDGDGRVAPAAIGDAMEPGPLTVSTSILRENLAASGVGVVAIVHLPHPGRSPERPNQHAALEAFGDARLLYRDAVVEIWKLGG